MATIEFWYEFASSYSYPAAMQVEEFAGQNGLNVSWRPFLLGPIFKAQGWDNSPFNIYPAKGEYMWRDMERLCQLQGLPFVRLSKFPQNSILAARLALCPLVSNKIATFSKMVYQAEFAEQKDISQPKVLIAILKSLNIDAQAALDQAVTPEVKMALRENTDAATKKKIFGAPSFVTQDGELFWGHDRLAQAVAWQPI